MTTFEVEVLLVCTPVVAVSLVIHLRDRAERRRVARLRSIFGDHPLLRKAS